MIGNIGANGHRDLRELRQDRRDAKEDGVVTKSEARELRHDRRQLEPGERKLVRAVVDRKNQHAAAPRNRRCKRPIARAQYAADA